MNEEQKNLVLKHWRELVRTCDTKKLYPKMLEKKIISERDIRDEFSVKINNMIRIKYVNLLIFRLTMI